jgi:glyoxylase-like metal-dependent hydrolase (beta-lactamase superfamily II)
MSDSILYTGGGLETNGFLLKSDYGWLCIDAPEGMAGEIARRGLKIEALLLTHGHFDHYWDAAEIAETHHCPVYCHRADWAMIQQPELFAGFVPRGMLRAVPEPRELAVPDEGTSRFSCGGIDFTLSHVPGHSPGSVTFYREATKDLYGGDVLFRNGVGRWDLPGGSQEQLLRGIRTHLLILPDEVKVHPGHGPSTTIGIERKRNPYLL